MPSPLGSGWATNSAFVRSAGALVLKGSAKGKSTVEAVLTNSSGLPAVKYFFSSQLRTTAPLLEKVTRYTLVSIVNRSSFCAAATGVGAAGLAEVAAAGGAAVSATGGALVPLLGG